ncbi:rapid alkalinization factor-like [Senna tora]|uniref:Rapid alkalinization factor-like n=1 Tax=Senna tora TaxID=362788 RepID=A0A834TIR5_9FABA|nr:rapid alkalinization factor-like [Senna tora]
MANSWGLLGFYLVMVSVMVHIGVVEAIGDHRLGWFPMSAGCSGSIEECLGEVEMKRRFLATSQYISYKALQRNTVPCSQRGASYYNCQPGFGGATGDGEFSTPISAFRSLMLCSNSSIRFPISSSA